MDVDISAAGGPVFGLQYRYMYKIRSVSRMDVDIFFVDLYSSVFRINLCTSAVYFAPYKRLLVCDMGRGD